MIRRQHHDLTSGALPSAPASGPPLPCTDGKLEHQASELTRERWKSQQLAPVTGARPSPRRPHSPLVPDPPCAWPAAASACRSFVACTGSLGAALLPPGPPVSGTRCAAACESLRRAHGPRPHPLLPFASPSCLTCCAATSWAAFEACCGR
ncbi:uncharacterized protein K452DRAFT_167654 [Aplosporella prunicola CBS 121167]|uniref:Uncharacterized protein n=1 Tax=Aplosporella prunicola CBS 121167 TaxID=1176127 RepID=A0A6A6BIS4_9PEZI|nr:uncharacterized protein K452DRAFT_167654 [Aplosporella prunicola CBS 121167]KAF2143215.1 hypothetical protein K452DRAFT_167654 [Aplosporella prunicola CBS 121167]